MGGEIFILVILVFILSISFGVICGLWAGKIVGRTVMGLIHFLAILPLLVSLSFLEIPLFFILYTWIMGMFIWGPYLIIFSVKNPKKSNQSLKGSA